MNKNLKYILKSFFVVGLIILCSEIFAQCPMCRAAAEQNLAEGFDSSKGLNKGIFYLFFTPYTIVFIIGTIWYFRYKKMQKLVE